MLLAILLMLLDVAGALTGVYAASTFRPAIVVLSTNTGPVR